MLIGLIIPETICDSFGMIGICARGILGIYSRQSTDGKYWKNGDDKDFNQSNYIVQPYTASAPSTVNQTGKCDDADGDNPSNSRTLLGPEVICERNRVAGCGSE